MSRPWYRSRFVRIGTAIVVAVVGAALAAPFLTSVDRYRALLVWAVEAGTGRQVEIGALKLYLVPNVRLDALNFRLKNPKGFPDGDALVAQSVDLGISLGPLLSRRLDVTYIAPRGVRINILRNAEGRTNFSLAPGKSAAPPTPGFFTLERIGVVHVRDAQVTFASTPVAGRPAYELSGVNGVIQSIDPHAADWPKKLDVAADLRGARLTTSLLEKPIEFHTGQLTFGNGVGRGTFALSLGSANLTGSATFAHLDPLSIEFTIAGSQLDLKTLASLVHPAPASGGSAPSSLRQPVARGTISFAKVNFPPYTAAQLAGRLNVYPGALEFNDFTLTAYGGTIHGNATFKGSSPGVPAGGTIRVRGFDAQRALSASGTESKNLTGKLDADLTLNTLLARDARKNMTATGTFAIRNGSFSNTRFSALSGDVRLARERLTSNHFVVNAYGGSIRGSGTVDASAATMPAAATLQARGLNAYQALSAMGATATKISGTLDADLKLTTLLARDVRAATTAAGSFTLAAYGGTIQGSGTIDSFSAGIPAGGNIHARGLNARQALAAIGAATTKVSGTLDADLKVTTRLAEARKALAATGTFALRNGTLVTPQGTGGNIGYSYLGGDLRIANERGYSNNVTLRANGMQATGAGSFGFNKTIDYRGTGMFTRAGDVASMLGMPGTGPAWQILASQTQIASMRVRVPFILRGTFDRPQLSFAGTPEVINTQAAHPQPQQTQMPSAEDLLKLLQSLPSR